MSWGESIEKNIEHTTMGLLLQAMRCSLDDPMFPWRMHISSYETILERIQEITNDLNSYMMNRATPHLEAWSSLRNNDSSNHHGQPRMGTPHASELKSSAWTSRWIRSTKKALHNKQRHPIAMESQRKGAYIPNQVKMHTYDPTLKHCIKYFYWIEREEDEINLNIRKISKTWEDQQEKSSIRIMSSWRAQRTLVPIKGISR